MEVAEYSCSSWRQREACSVQGGNGAPARLLRAGVFLGFALLCLFVGLEGTMKPGSRKITECVSSTGVSHPGRKRTGDTRSCSTEVNAQKKTNLHNLCWGSQGQAPGQQLAAALPVMLHPADTARVCDTCLQSTAGLALRFPGRR